MRYRQSRYLLGVLLLATAAGCGDGGGDGDGGFECGNGTREGAEQCDDGNTVDNDGCDSNCTLPACGNGVVNPGEACDDGNTIEGDGCDTNCTVSACGNGRVGGTEECDDGNTVDGDGCSATCTIPCGNGVLDPGEECDDGNMTNGDGCDDDTTGLTDLTRACTTTRCGNGIVTMGETCDDGNTINDDGCANDCTIDGMACGMGTGCGNCAVDGSEDCDDGNWTAGDGCDPNCTTPGCGNGWLDPETEECDDGNTVANDGCDASCNIESGANTPDVCGDGNQDTLSVLWAEFGYHAYRQGSGGSGCDEEDLTVNFYIVPESTTMSDTSDNVTCGGDFTPVYSTTVGGRRHDSSQNAVFSGPIQNAAIETLIQQAVIADNGASATEGEVRLLIGSGNCVYGDWAGMRIVWSNGTDTIIHAHDDDAPNDDIDNGIWNTTTDAGRRHITNRIMDGGGECVGEQNDTSESPDLGDQLVENVFLQEECDDGNTMDGDGCESDCTLAPFCGDGNNDGGEDCDDGNTIDGDGCDSNCTITGCGNLIITDGEVCDDGNQSGGDGCNASCDGIEGGFECPVMGSSVDGDAGMPFMGMDAGVGLVGSVTGGECSAVCGDGVFVSGYEQCDPTAPNGGGNDADNCESNCTLAGCGNGVTSGLEDCDDGLYVCDLDSSNAGMPCEDSGDCSGGECVIAEGDGCNRFCDMETCGNGFVENRIIWTSDDPDSDFYDPDAVDCAETSGEGIPAGTECAPNLAPGAICVDVDDDDDGAGAGDHDDNRCVVVNEECDDGNTMDGDGCDSNCTETACGNGIATGAEECDDGNTVSNDGCSNTCETNTCADGTRVVGELCFGAPNTFDTFATALAVADLDGDGDTDAVLATDDTFTVVLFDGTNDPTVVEWLVRENGDVTDVATGDFDGDGDIDVAAIDGQNDLVHIRYNDGTGDFCPCAAVDVPVGDRPQVIEAGDLNGDDVMDLVIGNTDNSVTALVFNGVLASSADASPQTYAITGRTEDLTLGDFDADGDLDVAVAIAPDDEVDFLMNDGSGSLSDAVGLSFSSGIGALIAVDLNGDGAADLVVGYAGGQADVGVLIANGDGSFGTPTTFNDLPRMQDFAKMDLDADGDMDVAGVGGENVVIFPSTGSGGFGEPVTSFFTAPGGEDIEIGDFNGDMIYDIATANGDSVSILPFTP